MSESQPGCCRYQGRQTRIAVINREIKTRCVHCEVRAKTESTHFKTNTNSVDCEILAEAEETVENREWSHANNMKIWVA